MDQLDFVAKSFGFRYRDIPDSFMESLKLNGTQFLHALRNDFHPLMEAENQSLIDCEFGEGKIGGIIVFSTRLNSTIKFEKADIAGSVKVIMATLKNGAEKDRKLTKLLFSHAEVSGSALGRFFKGRFVGDDGTTYDESSSSVEIIGISFELVCAIASEIAKEFQQQTVLVKDNASRRIVLINAKA